MGTKSRNEKVGGNKSLTRWREYMVQDPSVHPPTVQCLTFQKRRVQLCKGRKRERERTRAEGQVERKILHCKGFILPRRIISIGGKEQ